MLCDIKKQKMKKTFIRTLMPSLIASIACFLGGVVSVGIFFLIMVIVDVAWFLYSYNKGKKVGDNVNIGDILAYIHGNNEEKTKEAVEELKNIYELR